MVINNNDGCKLWNNKFCGFVKLKEHKNVTRKIRAQMDYQVFYVGSPKLNTNILKCSCGQSSSEQS